MSSPRKPVRQRAAASSSLMQCNRIVLSQSDSSIEGGGNGGSGVYIDEQARRNATSTGQSAAANTLTLGCLQPSSPSKAKSKKKATTQSSSAASRSSSTRATLHNETTVASGLTIPPPPPPPRAALPWATTTTTSNNNGLPPQWQQSMETATQLQLTGRGGFPIYHVLHISECEVLQPVGRWKFRLNSGSSSNAVTKPVAPAAPSSSRSALDPRRKSYPQAAAASSSRRKLSSKVMDVLNPNEQNEEDDSDDENINPMKNYPPTTTATVTTAPMRLSPAKFIETELRIGTVVVDCFRRHDVVTLHSRYESNKNTNHHTTTTTTTLTITIAECGRQQLAIIALLRHVPYAVCRAMGLHAIGDTATLEHVIHYLLQYGSLNNMDDDSQASSRPLPTFQFWSIGIPATLMSHCLYTNLMGLPGAMTKAAMRTTTVAKAPPPVAPKHKRGSGCGTTPQQQSTTTTATSSSQRPVRVCHDDWEDLDEDETDMLCRMMRK
jgi:hypothetical protein